MSVEANKTDRQGAQLSQECPHLSATSQWEQTTVRHNVIGIRPLVTIGPGLLQVVSEPAKSFHAGALISVEFLAASHQRAATRAPRLTLDSICARQNRSTSIVF